MDNNVTVTVKFTVKKDKLNDFFKEIAKLTDTFDLYWVEGINWPVEVNVNVHNVDPIKNVTGY